MTFGRRVRAASNSAVLRERQQYVGRDLVLAPFDRCRARKADEAPGRGVVGAQRLTDAFTVAVTHEHDASAAGVAKRRQCGAHCGDSRAHTRQSDIERHRIEMLEQARRRCGHQVADQYVKRCGKLRHRVPNSERDTIGVRSRNADLVRDALPIVRRAQPVVHHRSRATRPSRLRGRTGLQCRRRSRRVPRRGPERPASRVDALMTRNEVPAPWSCGRPSRCAPPSM